MLFDNDVFFNLSIWMVEELDLWYHLSSDCGPPERYVQDFVLMNITNLIHENMGYLIGWLLGYTTWTQAVLPVTIVYADTHHHMNGDTLDSSYLVLLRSQREVGSCSKGDFLCCTFTLPISFNTNTMLCLGLRVKVMCKKGNGICDRWGSNRVVATYPKISEDN
ncbi:hypothetical protein VNO77_01115 [Canavalia gladiata]|uniref:Uncharacterized protein n=1 Tax=Canavalia gladiata TaxID=3824 RepID=A0AAN9MVY3_CANGL